MTTTISNMSTIGDYNTLITQGGHYDPWGTWIPYYTIPYWTPPVYVQPTYVPGTVIFYPDEGLKEEVKGLKEEIKKLRKELAKK